MMRSNCCLMFEGTLKSYTAKSDHDDGAVYGAEEEQ